MKKLITLFFLFFNISIYASDATKEITEIYIDAKGNNKFEAQIKANAQGMERAFLIIVDKMKLDGRDISTIPYLRLKDTFSISNIQQESKTDESYSAIVNYKYDLYSIDQLLQDYGNEKIKDKFYEYLIIPVYKQKNIINIWESNQEWTKKWIKARTPLNYYKIYYPKPNQPLKQFITAHNIFQLTYNDFLSIFPNLLFKKVLIVVSEYFTIPSGSVVMNIRNIILEHNNNKNISETGYPLNSLQDVPNTVNKVIADTMKKYGSLRNDAPKNLAEDIQSEENATRTLILNVEIFDEDELKTIEAKLKNVKDIKRFEVNPGYGQQYKITIWTESDDYKLAEGFFLNGLSFKIYGNLYNLIDVKKGV